MATDLLGITVWRAAMADRTMDTHGESRTAAEPQGDMRIAKPGQSLPRGVYVAPWMGADGELVLLAITSTQRLACPPLAIPHGADRIAAADEAWAALDAAEPAASLKLHAG